MPRPKKSGSTEKANAGGTKSPALPEKLLAALQAGMTAYVSGEQWFFNEATAQKHFDKYETITPKDLK